MRIINIKTKNIFEYEPAKSGEAKSICPECSHSRKKKTDKCFSWNVNKKAGFCHNCEGSFVEYNPIANKDEKQYIRPEWKNKTELTDKAVKFFESRGITQKTLQDFKIYSDFEFMPQHNANVEVICFPYFVNDMLINIKFRAAKKAFKLSKDAELVFYNFNKINEANEIIIVEGEFDALAFYEAGLKNVISVPNGANKNLSYLDSCIDIFCGKQIIIATDNDIKGFELRNELIRRFGAENCSIIDFKYCKDANEYLLEHGRQGLNELYANKKDCPIRDIVDLNDNYDEIYNLFINGMQPGLGINSKLDELITWETGRLAIWTGIPGHGKSEFMDWVNVKLNSLHGWKMAYFSPENFPVKYHFSKIFSKILGKSFNAKYVTNDEFKNTYDIIKDNFFFLMPEENFSIDTILDKTKFLIKKHGIKCLIIDPYNKIEHQRTSGQTETEYISILLDKLVNFARVNDILIHLVAHPVKQQKDKSGEKYEVPNLYSISGSANFYNKADYGITVYRNYEGDKFTDIHVQKVKFRHLGEGGFISQNFNKINGRYEDIDIGNNPIEETEPLTEINQEFNFTNKLGDECPF